MVSAAQLTHGKAAEMQRRAVVHFHALVRLDGVHPDDPDIIAAFHHPVRFISFTTPAHPNRPQGGQIRWGDPDKGFDS
jgi:hypothetical protein